MIPLSLTVIWGTNVALPYVPAVTPLPLALTFEIFVIRPCASTVTCGYTKALPYVPAVTAVFAKDIAPVVLSYAIPVPPLKSVYAIPVSVIVYGSNALFAATHLIA